MSFPTLEDVRTQSNPIQPTETSDYWVTIDRYTGEYANYKIIPSGWSDAKCDGFIYIKAGTSYYERIISTPYVNVKWFGAVGSGASNPVSSQINPGTGVVFASLAEVQTYYPTAVSMSDEVDGLAIQNAINFAIYASRAGATKYVWLPNGTYRTSDTIHMGYGETFTSVVLWGGTTFAFSVNNNQKGPTILPQFTDRPGINIQGTRESMIQGISIIGKNTANPGYNNGTWWDPTLYLTTGITDSQYAPYAGITIDAYSGNPATKYPTVNYPVTPNAYNINITTQYNKNPSSRVHIDHCQVSSFVAGIVQQPSGANANGDFVKTTFTRVTTCKYGISSGGDEARLSEISNCNIDSCYYMVTNAIHGSKQGRINLIQNTHLSGYQMLYFVETAWNGHLILRDCYAESVFKIGFFGANRTNAGNLTIDHCIFKFDHSNGVPSALIEGQAGTKISIKGGTLIFSPTLVKTGGTLELDGVTLEVICAPNIGTGLADNSLTTWANFLTFTGGLPSNHAFAPGKDIEDCKFSASGLATDPFNYDRLGSGLGFEGNGSYNTDPGHDIGGYFRYAGHLSSNYLFKAKGLDRYTSLSLSGRLLTVPNGDLFISRLVSVSDVLIDPGYGTLWLVLSNDGTNTVLLLLNGYYFNAGALTYEMPTLATTPIDSASGANFFLYTGFNRTPVIGGATASDGALALIGDCTAGSAVISNIVSANATGGQVASQFAVIDPTKFLYLYLIPGTDPTVRSSSWQGPYNVVSIDTVNFKITVDINIKVTGKVYLFNTSIYNV